MSQKTKRNIYEEQKKDHPDIKMGKSNFYQLCPKYYKKAHKRTDMFPVCVKGESLEKKVKNIEKGREV